MTEINQKSDAELLAYDAGYAAFINGQPLSRCMAYHPFAAAFEEGWLNAEADDTEEN